MQEQYEDALFALMMDEVATAEGIKAMAENERLKNDPDAEVPEEITKQCMRTIRRHFAKQKARAAGRFTAKALGKAVMVAGIAAILFTGAFAASETVRINTLNMVVEVFGDRTDFHFSSSGSIATPNLAAGWLPDGYALENQGEDGAGYWCTFRKSENEYIYVGYTPGDGIVLSADTEYAETEHIKISEIEATLIQKENETQIVFGVQNDKAFIQLVGYGISDDELIRVATELKY